MSVEVGGGDDQKSHALKNAFYRDLQSRTLTRSRRFPRAGDGRGEREESNADLKTEGAHRFPGGVLSQEFVGLCGREKSWPAMSSV